MTNNENGRSMVEMLGVLAIIGVLSVTGIAGYTMAMRAYRANEAVQAAGLLYSAALSANGGTGEANINYATNFGVANPAGVTSIISKKDATTGEITIEVTMGTAPDCDAVAKKVGNSGTVRASDCSGTTTTISYNNS